MDSEPESPTILHHNAKEIDHEGRHHHEEMKLATEQLRTNAAILYKEKPRRVAAPRIHKLKPAGVGKDQFASPGGITGKRMTVKAPQDSPTLSDKDDASESETETQGEAAPLESKAEDDEEESVMLEPPNPDDGSSSSDDDLFDVKHSKDVLDSLLAGLNSKERTSIMEVLQGCFEKSTGRVNDNLDELNGWEGECMALEEEQLQAMKGLHNDIHNRDKQMNASLREFEDLVENMTKRAAATAKEKEEFNEHRAAQKKKHAKEQEKVALLNNINDLREKLTKGEAPAEDPEQQNHHTDLLKILALQQDEIMKLTNQAKEGEKKAETLKEALAYVEKGLNGRISDDANEVYGYVREKVKAHHETLKEQRKDADADKLDPIDHTEVLELEKDVTTLKERLVETEAEIEAMRSAGVDGEVGGSDEKLQAKALGISGDKFTDVAERAPAIKARLLGELARLQQEHDKLNEQHRQYEGLMQNAEQTLKSLEEQKTLFLVHIAQAKSTLLTQGEGAIVSQKTDDEEILGEDEEDEAAAAQAPDYEQKEAKALTALKDEEEKLKAEILDLETQLLVGASARQASAAAGAAAVVESEGAYAATEAGRRAGVVGTIQPSHVLEGLEVAPLREEDQRLCSRVEALRKRAIGERHRAGIGKRSSLPAGESSGVGSEATPGEGEDAQQSDAAKEEEEEEDEDLDDQEEVAYQKDTWEESENQKARRAQIHADMLELIRVKDENRQLQNELLEVSEQLAALKAQREQPSDLGRDGDEVDGVVEIRQKLREYTALRKKWWSERQDPKAICRRSMTHPETNGAVLCASTTSVGGIYARIHSSASQF